MNEIYIALISSVVTGLLAAIIFKLTMSKLRPKLIISDWISMNQNETGEDVYFIKVVNIGRRSAINLKAELRIRTPHNVHGGTIMKTNKLSLYRSEMLELPKDSREDKNAENAFRFRTNDNIIDMLNSNSASYLMFQVLSYDSFSGYAKVYTKNYYNKEYIKKGRFDFGNSLEIK
ncbi:hypothetical protein L0E83_06000 [Marichromatium gracile]|uniref:hypothetical protein n=1 Tax=Marichromatium gracile TaxID=1048 RepID=UPI001F3C44E4|nr:hypothetical protein [Marichromatium gracile]MCF1182992.1 hypothetical protein [Marichromatium gracile]